MPLFQESVVPLKYQIYFVTTYGNLFQVVRGTRVRQEACVDILCTLPFGVWRWPWCDGEFIYSQDFKFFYQKRVHWLFLSWEL